MNSAFQAMLGGLVWMLLSISTPTLAWSSTISISPNGTALILSGEIRNGDYNAITDLLQSRTVTDIVLDSPGGVLIDALQIGEELAKLEISTIVPEGAICASACGYIWLAGKRRSIESGARVGFHSPYEKGDEMNVSSSGSALAGAYLARLGFSDMLIIYATEAAPRDMRWLTVKDAAFLGVEVSWSNSDEGVVTSVPMSRTEVRQALLSETWAKRLENEIPQFFIALVDAVFEGQQKGVLWNDLATQYIDQYLIQNSDDWLEFENNVWSTASDTVVLESGRLSIKALKIYAKENPGICELLVVENHSSGRLMSDLLRIVEKVPDQIRIRYAELFIQALSEPRIKLPALSSKKRNKIEKAFEESLLRVLAKYSRAEQKELIRAIKGESESRLVCPFFIKFLEELLHNPETYLALVRYSDAIN